MGVSFSNEEDRTDFLVRLHPTGMTIYTGDSFNPTFFQEINNIRSEEAARNYMKYWVSKPSLQPNFLYEDGSKLYRVFDDYRLGTPGKMSKEEQLEKLKEFQAESKNEVLKIIWDGAIKDLPILTWDELDEEVKEHFRRTMNSYEELLKP